ncbi:hypothetical protein L249_7296 [Ophiocordyceps polyrhachis-furcata BCC 54312]|uniref:Uncharacterized protein n=1 Tax=Ophiocordyceps polyrhachis-furcata BCC 54312 TaxID=1330021 RepID=A0A367LAN8_9HYPO|nr:hypothetical protein L249_7296 [Ophiocordyceps polyrhachis-furcata BCC 54312]
MFGKEADEPSNITPAVPKHVIVKLLAFSLAMIVLPIGSYFVSVDTIFKGRASLISSFPDSLLTRPLQGNSSYAGAFAALLANVVLIAYVVVAMNEDASDRTAAKKSERKKDQ